MPSRSDPHLPAPPPGTPGHNAARQAMTPELRSWILAQAGSGYSTPVMLQSLRDAGWDAPLAAEILTLALQEHRGVRPLPPAQPGAAPMPGPRLDESPTQVDCGVRSVPVLLAMSRPRIVLLGKLLSAEECDALIAFAAPRMARSLTVATQTGGEGLQVLHYRPGAEYKPHYDYFDPAEPGTPSIVNRGGQRVGTLVMYLNTPEKGGGTTFPDVHLEVAPQRGNAVFFSYERPHPSTRTLHGGAPVIAGDKWIATKWLRERKFD